MLDQLTPSAIAAASAFHHHYQLGLMVLPDQYRLDSLAAVATTA